jgi:hypothetical protein
MALRHKNKIKRANAFLVIGILFIFPALAFATGGPQSANQSCAINSDCQSGYICSPTTFTCVTQSTTGTNNPSGGPQGPNQSCAINSDCQSGYICSPTSFTCVTQSQSTQGTNNNTGSGGTSGPCLGDPNLTPVNGVCLPGSGVIGVPTTGFAGASSLSGLIILVIQFLLGFAGLISIVVLIIGGYWYITAAGNEEMSEKGRKAITNAIIGLIIVMLSYAIVTIISATLVASTFP